MTEPTPAATYTGTETCPKCGSSDLTASYNKPENTVELQCRRCAHRWPVKPMDAEA